MVKKLFVLRTEQTNPYANLALEEYLLQQVQQGECILYLWQNSHTVVVGRNQNCWQECRIEELERDGGFLARRLSGGGAVYHDLGNLNFTFLLPQQDYDLAKQLEVILTALHACGIAAEKSGRNDITVEGKKCSGNAFYHAGGRSYHHGTLLLQVNLQALTRYLTVDVEKLRSKGVESVRARVANLADYAPNLTVQALCGALTKAFGSCYGAVPQALPPARLSAARLEALTEKYASWEWRCGRPIPFTCEAAKRFAWGDIQLRLCINAGCVTQVAAFSDGMDAEYIALLPGVLQGCSFTGDALAERVHLLPAPNAATQQMAQDIAELLRGHI